MPDVRSSPVKPLVKSAGQFLVNLCSTVLDWHDSSVAPPTPLHTASDEASGLLAVVSTSRRVPESLPAGNVRKITRG